ncbi:MAG: MBL fold metallo-hydrolase [Melioribacteraceae bacterium]|nr:MBL fold metallo-hydrolase [Melioribacteraceae bacterium]MCO6474161.1 MBL fold metallo-hydrolase [Melioribacteraceae bacterium]MDD3559332.1 MBL fold metallo-hydrolase [Melioribacteraceae bacterium]
MKIGKYNVSLIETTSFALDGGAMFGIIPKPLWEKTYPCDSLNRIKLTGRCLLIESDNKKILVDTGIGNFWDEKFKKIYDVEQFDNSVRNKLVEMDISPGKITDVILTHLHFDHTGGSTILEGDKFLPAFPHANYYVQREQFDWALHPSKKDAGSFIKNRFLPLAEQGVLNFIDGEHEFDDGIKLMPVHGHTFGQQLVKIFDSSVSLLFTADLIPTSSHIHIPYIMGYDIQPLKTIEEKSIYLPEAVSDDWILIFGHDNYLLGGKIEKTDKGYKIKERIEQI